MRPEISLSENSIMAHRTKAQWFLPPQGIPKREKWQDGLSPREYQIQQRAKERARDSITKAFVAQQRIKDSLKLADEKQKHQTEEQKSKHSSENMVNDTARLFIKENSNSA